MEWCAVVRYGTIPCSVLWLYDQSPWLVLSCLRQICKTQCGFFHLCFWSSHEWRWYYLSIYLSIYLSAFPFLSFSLYLSLSLSLSLPLLQFPAASLSHTIPLLEVTKWIWLNYRLLQCNDSTCPGHQLPLLTRPNRSANMLSNVILTAFNRM